MNMNDVSVAPLFHFVDFLFIDLPIEQNVLFGCIFTWNLNAVHQNSNLRVQAISSNKTF